MQLLQSHLICHLCLHSIKFLVAASLPNTLFPDISSGLECALICCLLQLMLNWLHPSLVGWLDADQENALFTNLRFATKWWKPLLQMTTVQGSTQSKVHRAILTFQMVNWKSIFWGGKMILGPIFSEHYWDIYTSWGHDLNSGSWVKHIFHFIIMRQLIC